MLLLLLDLLLGWILSFQPFDVCTSDALELVLVEVLEGNCKSVGLEEIIVRVEHHFHSKNHVLAYFILSCRSFNVFKMLHNWLVFFLDLIPNESVVLHGSKPEIRDSFFALEVAHISWDFFFFCRDGWFSLYDVTNLLLQVKMGFVKLSDQISKFCLIAFNYIGPLI